MVDLTFVNNSAPYLNAENLNLMVDQINRNEAEGRYLQEQVSALIIESGSGSVLYEVDGKTALASSKVLDSKEAIDNNTLPNQLIGAKGLKEALKDVKASQVKTNDGSTVEEALDSRKIIKFADFTVNFSGATWRTSGGSSGNAKYLQIAEAGSILVNAIPISVEIILFNSIADIVVPVLDGNGNTLMIISKTALTAGNVTIRLVYIDK